MTVSHPLLCTTVLFGCSAVAMVFDIRERRIPNKLVAIIFLGGIIFHMAVGGPAEAGLSVVAALIGGAVFLVFHVAGGMGAGDVKLMAALCSLAGIDNVKSLLIATVLAGAVCAVVFAVWKGALRRTLVNVVRVLRHHGRHGLAAHPELNVTNAATLRLPYAVPVAVACGWLLSRQLVAGGLR